MAEGVKRKLRDIKPDGSIWQNLEVKGVVVDYELRKIGITAMIFYEASDPEISFGSTGQVLVFTARDNPRKAEFGPVYEYLMQNADLSPENATFNMMARHVEVVENLPAGTCIKDFPPSIHPADLPEIQWMSMSKRSVPNENGDQR